MILKIQIGRDNPILRKKSVKISKFDKKLKKFVKQMIATMLAKNGVGLAAPQVGVNERVAILNFQLGRKKSKPIAVVNPEIVDASMETMMEEEGCLSLPGIFGKVKRWETVTIRFEDETGNPRALELDGLNSRAIQHEIDHLDGILFVDKVEGKIREEK
ncbi:MAG: peptide deformylase [Patescibacteria group bacterium]